MVKRIGLLMLGATWIAGVAGTGCSGSGTEVAAAPTIEQALPSSAITAGDYPCNKSTDGQCNCGKHGPGDCPYAKAGAGENNCGKHAAGDCPNANGAKGQPNCGKHGPGDCAMHGAAEGADPATGAAGGCPHAANTSP